MEVIEFIDIYGKSCFIEKTKAMNTIGVVEATVYGMDLPTVARLKHLYEKMGGTTPINESSILELTEKNQI